MFETVHELATALRSGALTAQALLERCLARIAAQDGVLNSFVAIDETAAWQAARESDARLASGAARSALEGIPLSIKDNILVKAMPATWGSRALAGFVPERDELPVARLREAGAIILGKTNVPELTLEGYTSNDLFGTTRNPFNTELTPGGSSGGAAASVAAGLVPAAIGTDGGGSIRRPACHTGLVGWKPSTGHIPRLWGFPSILTDFEVVGTLTRTVADAMVLDDVLKGADQRDRRSLLSRPPVWPDRKRRVLYIPQFANRPVDPEITAATTAFANQLAENGAEVVPGEVFFDLEMVNSIWRTISRVGVDFLMRRQPSTAELAGASVRAMAEEGRTITGAKYLHALEQVAALRMQMSEVFSTYDLVLTPSAAALPWPAGQAYPDVINGQAAGPRDHAIFTGWVNIAGLPAMALPAGLSKDGLPIGIQLIAGFGRDAELLQFAEEIS
ncbi:amidase [Rhizobium sp.]|jgi:aspartyl-tRNA(Asn)/glutamyl-tRNA(Gln) amidotransferase subunit A|uniref:amidase n=1 Tax=Rhizobium sp. TaxID=391 RepID=UPI002AA6EE7A